MTPEYLAALIRDQRIPAVFKDSQFRWEFLRRSDKYKMAYQRFIRRYPGWHGYDPSWLAEESLRRRQDPRNPDRTSFISQISRSLRTFHRKWGIDPRHPESGLPPDFSPHTWWISEWDARDSRDPDLISIHIDIRGPVEEIVENLRIRIETERLLNSARRQPREKVEKKTRKRLLNYIDYLLAFDLKKQTRKSDREIASSMFPGQQVSSERIRYFRNRARHLIERAEKGQW